MREVLGLAGAAGVQVACLQEAWHMPFAFCTREREWCEFAECAEAGPSVALCAELARRHNMVVVCPILERDASHQGTIWNTAVVVGNTGTIIGKHRKVCVCVRRGGKGPRKERTPPFWPLRFF